MDIHCHIFNATGFPGKEFVREVKLPDYLPPGSDHLLDPLLSVILQVITGGAPNGGKEKDLLRKALGNDLTADQAWGQLLSGENDANFLAEMGQKIKELRMSQNPHEQELGQLLADAFGDLPATDEPTERNAVPMQGVGETADTSGKSRYPRNWPSNPLGNLIEFVRRVKQYRFENARRIFELYGDKGQVGLVCPTIMDYDYWLRRQTPAEQILNSVTRLETQMEVMDLVSQVMAKKEGKSVHGYMAYDPLRDELEDGRSLSTVKAAVNLHGFVGVKLYPAMGFQPCENRGLDFFIPGTNQRDVWPPDMGERLDARLAELFKWCLEEDVPVLSHTNASVFPEPDYQYRPSPFGWTALLERLSKNGELCQLRVVLGHFGGLNDIIAKPDSAIERPENERIRCWVAEIKRLCLQYPNAYIDLSFHPAVLRDHDDPNRMRYVRMLADTMRAPGKVMRKKICFGTDWLMLSQVSKHGDYRNRIEKLLREELSLDNDSVADVMGRNALRFLGLDPTTEHGRGKNADRLRAYYELHKISLPPWWPEDL